jgi:signal transduction histidine kinase/ligand-binding sensor domain-containing protein/CheY-like chemotaxis protein
MRLFLLLIISILSLTSNLLYGKTKISFTRFTVDEGMSGSWVNGIMQDDAGFIWFGTKDGLNRFDGNEFKIYRYDHQDSTSLSNNTIFAVDTFYNGKIIVCTASGVNIFNPRTDNFTHFKSLEKSYILSMKADTGGFYWFGTREGFYHFNLLTGNYTHYSTNDKWLTALPSNNILSFHKDFMGRLWVGTISGLAILDMKNKNVQVYNSMNSLSANYINDICEDVKGNILVGTSAGGLDICYKADIVNPIIHFKNIVKASVIDILVDKSGTVWLANGTGYGLMKLIGNDYSNCKVEKYLNDLNDENSLSDNSLEALFQDKWGNIWAGSHSNGANYYNPHFKKFNTIKQKINTGTLSNSIINVFYEDEKFMWIGTENGLNRIDKKTNHIDIYQNNPSVSGSIGGNAIFSIFKDRDGNIWVGGWSTGLNLYNYQTNTFTTYRSNPLKPNSLPSDHVYAINEDEQGYLWLGSIRGGLTRFDKKSKICVNFFNIPGDSTSISDNDICVIKNAGDNKLWLSTYVASELFDIATGKSRHYNEIKKSPGDLITIFKDSKGNTWFGGEGGLSVIDKNNVFLHYYDKRSGLTANSVKAMLEDKSGNLWISTSNGLSKFENAIYVPDTPVFRNYKKQDGLQGNEFSVRAACKGSDGTFYFGGTRGFTSFHPDSIIDNTVVPPIVITDFKLYKSNRPIIRGQIDTGDTINLSYNQADFTIHFAALNYLSAANNQFKYRLDGYEEDWHDTGSRRMAIYTNINPGKYVFRVIGSNNDNVWNTKGTKLYINILPPWWRTSWFILLALVCIVLIIIGIYRLRLKSLRKQKQQLEIKVSERTEELLLANKHLEEDQEEIATQNNELEIHRNHLEKLVSTRTYELQNALKKAEESDKLKSAFLANMSHEIRTPMNAILGFSSLLSESDITDELRNHYVKIIEKNCDSLMVLINDILDISLIEADQLKISNTNFELNQVLREIEQQILLQNKNNIAIQYVTDNNPLIIQSDLIRFNQIMTNLLNNALKFTLKGQIRFGYRLIDDKIEFFVEDTGIGIDPKNIDQLFLPFGKLEPKSDKLFRGTGLGLSISKKLVELLGGQIWFQSTPNSGTTFYFTLPYKKVSGNKEKESKPIHKGKNGTWEKINILVAEDEPDNFYLINEILRPTKANVNWLKNGAELIAYINSQSVQENTIILMDIKMPIINGIEALKQIRNKGYNIPVIAITAHAHANEKEEIMKNDFNEYLSKPIKKDDLIKLISKLYQNMQ